MKTKSNLGMRITAVLALLVANAAIVAIPTPAAEVGYDALCTTCIGDDGFPYTCCAIVCTTKCNCGAAADCAGI